MDARRWLSAIDIRTPDRNSQNIYGWARPVGRSKLPTGAVRVKDKTSERRVARLAGAERCDEDDRGEHDQQNRDARRAAE